MIFKEITRPLVIASFVVASTPTIADNTAETPDNSVRAVVIINNETETVAIDTNVPNIQTCFNFALHTVLSDSSAQAKVFCLSDQGNRHFVCNGKDVVSSFQGCKDMARVEPNINEAPRLES